MEKVAGRRGGGTRNTGRPLPCIVHCVRAVVRIVVTVVVGWTAAVMLSGCAGIFGPSGTPSVAADSPSVSPAVPTKAVTVEFCQNNFSATYERGMERDLGFPATGYIELTNIGTTDCTLVGSPLLAFSFEDHKTSEQVYQPRMSFDDAYYRGRTPVRCTSARKGVRVDGDFRSL